MVLTVFPPGASAAERVGARGWTSPEVVVGPGCEPDAATTAATATAGPGALVRGFVSYVRGTCTGNPVWYFQGTAGHWTRARSPYHGDVLAVAAHRITTVGTGYPQARPALALTADRAGRPGGAVLAWARDVGSRTTFVENDELWYARAGLAGRWTGRAVLRAPARPYALSPAIARNGCTTWLAWQRQSMDIEGPADSRILATDDPARAGTAHLFTAAGGGVVLTAPAGARSAPSPGRAAGRAPLPSRPGGRAAGPSRPSGSAPTAARLSRC